MTYAQAIVYIQQWIIDNNNKEITAAIMRDVLENMLLYARDSIGEVQLLEEGDNVVEAVNILFGMFDSLEVNLPIDVHTGVDDPNVTPPDNFNAPDFYIRNGNQTYIYTGTSWVLIQDSSTSTTPSLELVVQQGNTTSLPIVGTDYFLDKSNNDFAQVQDLLNALGGGGVGGGLRIVKEPTNTEDYLQEGDYAEGWVTTTMFVDGIYKGVDNPTQADLENKDNWSHKIIIE